MIILEPQGGLANRMRVVASGLAVVRKSNHKLAVIWNLNKELNCDFDLLFNKIPDITFIEKKEKLVFLHRSNQTKFIKKIKAYLRNKILGIDYFITEGDMTDLKFREKINKIIKYKKNIFISTTQKFGHDYNEFKHFVPVNKIQCIINKQIAFFGDNTIGIHIRQTDNFVSIDNSPVELFVDKIKEEINRNVNVTFFLATDNPILEDKLIKLFGTKIIAYKKELNRNSQQGIIDAVVDMFCLSKTKYIYGSYWSSFSDIASVIGGIDKIILKK
jgi:hypothetical protein